MRDAELGRRHVDKLVSVFTNDGREDWICIHVEVQRLPDGAFARRMFVYNYRIFDRYDRPVASLAVLGDDDPHWRPDRFSFGLLGCCHSLTCPVEKLIDREGELATLPADPNPFALVTVAHLLTRRTRDAPYDRFQAKRRLVRLLYERNWSKTRILGFFAVLDWMMRLPEELETEADPARCHGAVLPFYLPASSRSAAARAPTSSSPVSTGRRFARNGGGCW